MRRVAIVGMGIVSSLGNSAEEIVASLRAGKSGIEFVPERKEMGFRSALAGTLKNPPAAEIPKKYLNSMSFAGKLAVPVVQQAIAAARWEEGEIKSERTGVIVGNSGGMSDVFNNCLGFYQKTKSLGGTALQKTMNSSVSANLSVWLGTRGWAMTVATACASGASAIGVAFQLVRNGLQDRMLCGGVQEGSWQYDCNFDALRAFSMREQEPTKASRPFDKDRDGLVPSAGCGFVALEEWESAKRRGTPICGEIIGFASNSDGYDMTIPSGVGSRECMKLALADAGLTAGQVDYINAHATSTSVGDIAESQAIRDVFGDGPLVSSTKSMTGHEIGAAGSNELIYTMLMIQRGFVAPSINIDNLDEQCGGINIVANRAVEKRLGTAVSNSFGFGGVNSCLVVRGVE